MMPQRTQKFRHVNLPQTPDGGELVQTLEHVTGRPADLREVANLQRQLNVPQSDYAPGGDQGIVNRVVLR